MAADACPACHHLHIDYTDEPCVSCGCDLSYIAKHLREHPEVAAVIEGRARAAALDDAAVLVRAVLAAKDRVELRAAISDWERSRGVRA